MFTAIIIACHLANAEACIQLTDNRGPYNTLRECNIRLNEMLGSTMRIYVDKESPYLPTEATCNKSGSNV